MTVRFTFLTRLGSGPRFGTVRGLSTGAIHFFDVHFRVSTTKSPFWRSQNRLRKKKVWNDFSIIGQIWARSGGSPDPLSTLENVATLGKRAKTGSLIGPSNSPKDLFNWAPPALLLGFAISKQRRRRNNVILVLSFGDNNVILVL